MVLLALVIKQQQPQNGSMCPSLAHLHSSVTFVCVAVLLLLLLLPLLLLPLLQAASCTASWHHPQHVLQPAVQCFIRLLQPPAAAEAAATAAALAVGWAAGSSSTEG
jgi:hypothetical protein